MLLKFTVSNFRSFTEPQTLNLMANGRDKSLPGNLISPSLPGLAGKSWLKGAVIYGANASGKTTLIDAMKALSEMIEMSAKHTDENEPIEEIEYNRFHPDGREMPTAFSIVFVCEGVRFEYRVAATVRLIHHESLRSFDKGAERMWFSRESVQSDDSPVKYHFTPEKPSGMKRHKDIERRTLRNVLYLSKANAENVDAVKPIVEFLVRSMAFLDLSSKSQGVNKGLILTLMDRGLITDNFNPVDLLSKADLGVDNIKILDRESIPDRYRESIKKLEREPELYHKTREGSKPLPWKSESAGTQRFFALLGEIIIALECGFVMLVDELETSLHPVLLNEVIRLFFSEESNKNGAQIIFTSHNPMCLDLNLLRRDQIWFTEKDEYGEGHLYPLTDYSPRNDESLTRGYLAGRYGGIPNIPEGLISNFNNNE